MHLISSSSTDATHKRSKSENSQLLLKGFCFNVRSIFTWIVEVNMKGIENLQLESNDKHGDSSSEERYRKKFWDDELYYDSVTLLWRHLVGENLTNYIIHRLRTSSFKNKASVQQANMALKETIIKSSWKWRKWQCYVKNTTGIQEVHLRRFSWRKSVFTNIFQTL